MGSVIEIAPITRVEGHGRVEVHLEGRRVERVELCLNESPRLFEALLKGKGCAEVPEIVCRICALCSTIHKVTALVAVERALGVEVPEPARLTRELIVQGGMIQDHALHLYCLVLPDLLDLSGVAELARHVPELLKKGLAIKRAGNLIQETLGGRLIHPVNTCLGGIQLTPERDTLLRLKEELLAILPACRETIGLFREPFGFPPLPAPEYLALEPSLPSLSATVMRMTDGKTFPVQRYRDYIEESVIPYSNAKHALVLGKEPTVGALARLNLGAGIGPETAVLENLQGQIMGSDIRGNNLAQAVELCQAAESALALIGELLEVSGDSRSKAEVTATTGEGSAACEAPRGVLIHSYRFEEGICSAADVITPTSLNQGALARDLLALARGMEGADANVMKRSLERLIRCYDPCISCSVHLLHL